MLPLEQAVLLAWLTERCLLPDPPAGWVWLQECPLFDSDSVASLAAEGLIERGLLKSVPIVPGRQSFLIPLPFVSWFQAGEHRL